MGECREGGVVPRCVCPVLAWTRHRAAGRDQRVNGFRQIQTSGERLPAASHYASQIAEIVSRGASLPLNPEVAFELYQEVLEAVEAARAAVLGEQQAQ